MISTPGEKWGLDIRKAPRPVQASLEPIVRFFSYHDAHPIALTMALMEKFGVDWLEWEPETLKSEIETTFRSTSVSEHNWQKIQAVRTLTRTVGFWKEWHIFEKIIQALNNNVPRFDITQRCTMAQLYAGVDIANQIRKEEFDEEIPRYVTACARDEGVIFLPSPLGFAQRLASKPMLHCNDCGKDETDDIDGQCSFCCGRFQDEHPLNFKPSKHLPATAGTHVRKYLEFDPAPVEKRFLALKNKGWDAVQLQDDNAEDVQSTKLMVAYEYMQLRRRQLVDQLEELKSWVTH